MERFGLLGERLGHSLSPQIHGYFGEYPYTLIEKDRDELATFFAAREYRAINVTIPYKKDVMAFCDELDEIARRIGSVNTIRFDEDAVRGYNTDYAGFRYLLEKNSVPIADNKVLVLGSGGSSVTACCVLHDMQAREVVVISRSGENNYQNLDRHSDAAVIVNTTPVGMFPHNSEAPVNLAKFPTCRAVVDIIYNPLKTKLLLDAEERGILAVNGLEMLVAQGKRAAEIFFAKAIDDAVVENTVRSMEKRFRNVVLVGMPGCGKSTVGKLLAEQLEKSFVDTDVLVEQAADRPIPEIMASEGETAFRDREQAAVAEAGKQLSRVIATGGGAILREDNCRALRQNAQVVFLERPLEKLATAGRPLSKGGAALAELYEQRLPLYRALADVTVAVDDDPAVTCERILEVLK